MIVQVGDANVNLTDVYTLNHSAATLWEAFVDKDFVAGDLVDLLCEKYEVTREVAQQDVDRLLSDWKAYGLLL